jgi:precorrin-4 methylase
MAGNSVFHVTTNPETDRRICVRSPNIFSSFILLLLLSLPINAWSSQHTLTIAGLVKRPLTLSVDDLAKFQSVTTRINQITSKGSFHGVFNTQGVPLRHLLDLAQVEKEASPYNKPVDLAILVRDKSGNKVALAWGEVFYRNPADVIIAYSTTPIMPHHNDCTSCHEPGFTKPYLDQLSRTVALPKLVMANDFAADRSLEGIVSIEVVNLNPKGTVKKKGELHSPRISISGGSEHPITVFDLVHLPRTSVTMNIVGDGKGFHGRSIYTGTPLTELLAALGVAPDLQSILVVTSPDGYQSSVSWGELSLSPQGQRIIIADEMDGKPLEKNGKFTMVLPDDLAADRDVKAVSKIEIRSLNQPGKIYIIGMGPGDTDLITREAFTRLGRTDTIVAPEELFKTFASSLPGKPLLLDSMNLIHKWVYAKAHPEIADKDLDKSFTGERAKAAAKIKEVIASGKNVAFMDWGDPLIYGSSHWIRGFFNDEQIETVPSLSAFNVANAVLARNMTCNGSVVMTVPRGIKSNEGLLKAAAEKGDTLVIFMGLKEFKEMLPLFRKYYAATTPVAIVYNAGISSSEKTVRGTLDDIIAKTVTEQEQFLGMIYIGPCLEQKGGECH